MKEVAQEQLETIRESAQLCRDTAAHVWGVKLEYNERSLLMVDELIADAWPNGLPRDPAKAYQMWGSFIGEAVCAILGGKWVTTEAGFGVLVGNVVAHPFAKIEKRFVNGMDDSIAHFYKAFRHQLGLATVARRSWWPFGKKK